MMPTAMKRKRDDADDAPLTSTDQRKSILDISMLKLRTSPPRKVEPSLRRSVLIFNTLKNIEAQLKLEGVTIPPNPTPELLPVIEDHSDVIDVAPCCNQGNCCNCSHSNQYHMNNGISAPHCSGVECSHCAYRQNPAYPAGVHVENTGRLPCAPYQPAEHAPSAPHPAANHSQPPPCFQSELTSPAPPVQHSHASHSNTTFTPPSSSQSNESYHYQANTPSQSHDAFQHHHSNASSCSMSMSVTETLLSDTSKMLDSLLSSDKLVAVASFTSLFELDSTGSGSTVASSNQLVTNSNHLNDSSNMSQDWGSQECTQVGAGTHCGDWGSRTVTMTTTDSSNQWCTSTYQQLSTPSSGGYSSTASCGSTSLTSTCSVSQQQSSHQNTAPHSASVNTAPLNPPPSPLTCRQEYDSAASNTTLGDIDCNMFDFDLFMPSLSPSMKLTPLNHDDLAHTLPSTEMPFGAPTWAPKSEHITDDLDHIMQILVGL